MEYALEGYGYVRSRVIRAALSRAPLPAERQAVVDTLLERYLVGARGSLARPGHQERIVEYVLRCAGVASVPHEEPPELLTTLRERGEEGPLGGLALAVATAAKEVFDRARGRGGVDLTHCALAEDAQEGTELVLGIHAPTMSEWVRRGDRVSPGTVIALRGDPGGGVRLEVLTRIFRVLCENGNMMYEGEAAGVVDAQWLAMPCDPRRIADEIARRVAASLEIPALAAKIDFFRAAAVDPLEAHGGQLAQRVRRELPFDTWLSVMERYRRAGEWTRWGLANALTAEARWSPRFAEAAKLERLGGLVACAAASAERHATTGAWWEDMEEATTSEKVVA